MKTERKIKKKRPKKPTSGNARGGQGENQSDRRTDRFARGKEEGQKRKRSINAGSQKGAGSGKGPACLSRHWRNPSRNKKKKDRGGGKAQEIELVGSRGDPQGN